MKPKSQNQFHDTSSNRKFVACHVHPADVEKLDLLALSIGVSRSKLLAMLINRACVDDSKIREAVQRVAMSVYIDWQKELERNKWKMTQSQTDAFFQDVEKRLSKKKISPTWASPVLAAVREIIRNRGTK